MKSLVVLFILINHFSFGQGINIPPKHTVIFGSNGTVSKPMPCPMDTLKGMLIWHEDDHVNSGFAWTYGYWIGKCGPIGAPIHHLTFIPGVIRYTNGTVYINSGFRDHDFKPISAKRVYGFIMMRDSTMNIDTDK